MDYRNLGKQREVILSFLERSPRGTKTKLAKAMGVPVSALSRYLKGGNILVDALRKAIKYIEEGEQ